MVRDIGSIVYSQSLFVIVHHQHRIRLGWHHRVHVKNVQLQQWNRHDLDKREKEWEEFAIIVCFYQVYR